MIAGRLKYRITILCPEVTKDKFGAKATIWKESATVRAERVKYSGRRSNEVGEAFPNYTVEYNIRDAHAVKANWRVKDLKGNLYAVNAIIPNIDRGFNTLVCESVNE